ncbi:MULTISPECIES: methyltransferase domain-containing protein [unclassified Brevundimonas]|uniref:methyltransferase domain-containing protein n=1 Tax=unclassified Brevundimonas TaxID=2622653 RepID=UPI0025BEC34A|nr:MULTISPECIES: methyltransferase domain-containing protein [unclassified Brevundimonas]
MPISDDALDYNLDQVSILGRALYIGGWARALSPRILLDGRDLPFMTERVVRADVASFFDEPDAATWGFVLVAMLPEGRIDRTRLTVQLRIDVVLTDPARFIIAGEDYAGKALIEGFISKVHETKGSLLELGSRARSGNSYRGLFPDDIEYTGIDITSGPNVDVVGDAHSMSDVIDKRFDYIFSISVFEHLLMPWKVAIEMGKVLKPGGLAYIQSHSAYPLHDEPWDFWRFSKNAWSALFNAHTGFEVVDAQYRYPAFVVPKLIGEAGHEDVSTSMNHLVSACLVRKVGEPKVEWAANTADVYDLGYSHGER